MFFKSAKLLGLDVGTSTIKLAELDVSGRSATLNKFIMAPTPPQTVVGGDIIQPQAVSETIAAMVREMGTKRNMVATGLWGTSVIVKKITIPKMEEKLIGDQIRWEAEQYIPFDINEVNIEFEVLNGKGAGGESMDILLVAARQENVLKYAEMIAQAGLTCTVLDVGGFALANCFQKSMPEAAKQTVALVNIGASVTNLVILEKGRVTFCRDIAAGGLTYTSELQKNMGISFEEAESLKISASQGQAAPDEATKIISAAHDAICDEVQASFDFFSNTSQENKITTCYYSGGASRTSGLVKHLGGKIQVALEPLNPFHNIKTSSKLSESYIGQIRDFSSVAIGLGLRKAGDA